MAIAFSIFAIFLLAIGIHIYYCWRKEQSSNDKKLSKNRTHEWYDQESVCEGLDRSTNSTFDVIKNRIRADSFRWDILNHTERPAPIFSKIYQKNIKIYFNALVVIEYVCLLSKVNAEYKGKVNFYYFYLITGSLFLSLDYENFHKYSS